MRFNVATPISYGDGQTYWQRLGKAFKNDQTGAITVFLNALPLPGEDGKVKLMLFEDKENRAGTDNTASRGAPPPRQGPQRSYQEELDDEIPF